MTENKFNFTIECKSECSLIVNNVYGLSSNNQAYQVFFARICKPCS